MNALQKYLSLPIEDQEKVKTLSGAAHQVSHYEAADGEQRNSETWARNISHMTLQNCKKQCLNIDQDIITAVLEGHLL